jgi:phage-related minor tail protein
MRTNALGISQGEIGITRLRAAATMEKARARTEAMAPAPAPAAAKKVRKVVAFKPKMPAVSKRVASTEPKMTGPRRFVLQVKVKKPFMKRS